jgi:Leucine-rich repeat (LRR) protein
MTPELEPLKQLLFTCKLENILLAKQLAKGLKFNLNKWLAAEGFGQLGVKKPEDLATVFNAGKNLEVFQPPRQHIITNARVFLHFPSLKSLELNDQNITDLFPLTQLPNLKILYLGNNGLTNAHLDAFKDFNKLEELYLWGNKLESIHNLAHLTNLRALTFNNNKIKDISPIVSLHKLYYLVGSTNEIEDIRPLAILEKNPITRIDFNYNPLPKEQVDIFMTLFKDKGANCISSLKE